MDLTRDAAAALDAADALAGFRERFVISDPERLYLDGNSLGRLPVATRDRLAAMAEDWGDRLVSGWHEWIEAPVRAGDELARVIGASPGEVLACDSTTVNLYKLVHAMLDAAPGIGTLVGHRDDFPTDRYILEGIAAARGLELRLIEGEPAPSDVPPDSLAVFSHVNYRTGAVADIAAFSGHIVWDLSHAAGAVPVDLNAQGVELAVGCTYKYLNAGPGAPGYLYVAAALQERLR